MKIYDNIRILAGKMVRNGNFQQGYDRKRPDADCGTMWDRIWYEAYITLE